jgi:uncharacterized Fe-S cluster-containing radical SAM superfamily protein
MTGDMIVTDFGDSEVRIKSGINLPKYFREWLSAGKEIPLYQKDWEKVNRRTNAAGYPPFDIFSDWLMDFASIAASRLGRNDWQNFRRLILFHISDCPLFCWYCFNDAWKDFGKIKSGSIDDPDLGGAEGVVSSFLNYRSGFESSSLDQVNVLRISGGEPFLKPNVIQKISEELRKQTKNKEVFLWIDTNLFPLRGTISKEHEAALKEIKKLGNKAAIHACLHGADVDSFERNTCKRIDFKNLIEGLKILVDYELDVFPRINPIGLSTDETKKIFDTLLEIDDLPIKTYLGPIELSYPAAIDRMKVFCGKPPINKTKSRPNNIEPKLPEFMPTNAVIYTWNRLMEDHYGFGYGVIPRHLTIRLTTKIKKKERKDQKKWRKLLLFAKGWAKEYYALKLLEILALPENAIVYVEYENKWVEPTFLAHVSVANEYYENNKNIDVLFIASEFNKEGLPKIVPLRWGTVSFIKTNNLASNHSLIAKISLGRYAIDFYDKFIGNESQGLSDKLARYIGRYKLPFTNIFSGHFCQFIALELSTEDKDRDKESDFKSTVVNIVSLKNEKAKRDVYYHIKEIISGSVSKVLNNQGKLEVNEGEDVLFLLEACNPKLGNIGYPGLPEAGLEVLSTEPDDVVISPSMVTLNKYGEQEIHVRFPRKGEIEGLLIFRPVKIDSRLAEIRIPYCTSSERMRQKAF